MRQAQNTSLTSTERRLRRRVAIFELMNQMASIKRFSRDFMVHPESVLEHTGFCVLFSVFVVKELQYSGFIEVDLGEVLERVAVHDVDEAALGDIPRVTKYLNATLAAEFYEAERKAVTHIDAFLNADILSTWLNAKDDTLEGDVVALADLASVVYKLWSEVTLHSNMGFLRVARELKEFVTARQKKMKLAGSPVADWLDDLVTIIDALRDNNHPMLSQTHFLSRIKDEPDYDNEKPYERQMDEEIPF